MITHAIIDHELDEMRFFLSEHSMFQDASYMVNCGLATPETVVREWSYTEIKRVGAIKPTQRDFYVLERAGELLTGPASGESLLTPEWGMPVEGPFTIWQISKTLEIQVSVQCQKKPATQLLDRIEGRC